MLYCIICFIYLSINFIYLFCLSAFCFRIDVRRRPFGCRWRGFTYGTAVGVKSSDRPFSIGFVRDVIIDYNRVLDLDTENTASWHSWFANDSGIRDRPLLARVAPVGVRLASGRSGVGAVTKLTPFDLEQTYLNAAQGSVIRRFSKHHRIVFIKIAGTAVRLLPHIFQCCRRYRRRCGLKFLSLDVMTDCSWRRRRCSGPLPAVGITVDAFEPPDRADKSVAVIYRIVNVDSKRSLVNYGA